MTEFRLPHADPSPSKSPKGLQSSISFAAGDIYYLYKGLSFRQRAAHITVHLYRWKGQRVEHSRALFILLTKPIFGLFIVLVL